MKCPYCKGEYGSPADPVGIMHVCSSSTEYADRTPAPTDSELMRLAQDWEIVVPSKD